jgi:methylphosphotriester-DNA--protein-cysteine methyltransferase
MMPARQDMVDAMRHNDASFNGRFIVGVHSTGIYCLPSCRARLPLLKNVRFYPGVEDARKAGLRACKRCQPDQYPNAEPSWLQPLVAYMRNHPDTRLTEHALVERAGVDISTIRRTFRHQYGTTPLAHHRQLRLERARQLIESGMDYLAAAYECGYESASGFRDAFARKFGQPPGSLHGK